MTANLRPIKLQAHTSVVFQRDMNSTELEFSLKSAVDKSINPDHNR